MKPKELAQDFEFELEIGGHCRKSGCIFTKSGYRVLFGIQIGKSGIACKIGKIPTKSGKLACMHVGSSLAGTCRDMVSCIFLQ